MSSIPCQLMNQFEGVQGHSLPKRVLVLGPISKHLPPRSLPREEHSAPPVLLQALPSSRPSSALGFKPAFRPPEKSDQLSSKLSPLPKLSLELSELKMNGYDEHQLGDPLINITTSNGYQSREISSRPPVQ